MQSQIAPQKDAKERNTARRARNSSNRPWTAVERYKLRGLIDRGLPGSRELSGDRWLRSWMWRLSLDLLLNSE